MSEPTAESFAEQFGDKLVCKSDVKIRASMAAASLAAEIAESIEKSDGSWVYEGDDLPGQIAPHLLPVMTQLESRNEQTEISSPACQIDAAEYRRMEQAVVSQPFTVEWLCEIGGVVLREDVLEHYAGWEDDIGWLLAFDAVSGTWSFRGEPLGERQPKTRGDVLKWLDVLGIVPATMKVGDK